MRKTIIAFGAAAALVGVIWAVATSPGPAPPTTPGNPLQSAEDVPIKAADRQAITATLDAFVASAVERQHPERSYTLVTQDLRASTTRDEWKAGTMPVFPYQAKEQHMDGWHSTYSRPGRVGLELLLHPAVSAGPEVGAIAFTVAMERHHGKWLVANFYPNAMFAPETERSNIKAEPDLGPAAKPDVTLNPSQLDQKWILVPFALAALPLLAGIGYLAWTAIGRIRGSRQPQSEADRRALESWHPGERS
jgi:hypothetical protein